MDKHVRLKGKTQIDLRTEHNRETNESVIVGRDSIADSKYSLTLQLALGFLSLFSLVQKLVGASPGR